VCLLQVKQDSLEPPLLGDRDVREQGSLLRRWWLAGLLAALAGAVLLLHTFSPEDFPFYPRCGLFTLTGFHCPGCGSLRALHHLTHGRVGAALDSNALLVCSLALGCTWSVVRRIRNRPLLSTSGPGVGRLVAVVLGAAFIFGLLRNLPWYPFPMLAP
jgi:hypothetical protein